MKERELTSQPLQHALLHQAFSVCPPDIQILLRTLTEHQLEHIEELRFRVNQPLQLCGSNFDLFLHRGGGLTDLPTAAVIISPNDMSRVVQIVTQSSLYAYEEELRRGYVTMPGGNRVGVTGRAVLSESGTVRTLRNITSVNVRIAKERIGVADSLRPFLYDKTDGTPYNVLIISPPQCGKTTLLRDITRQWSEGTIVAGAKGVKVCVVDERSEIAGCMDGVPQFHLGPRTDVLDACPKAEGMLMMIRSLSPMVIVTDEIGRAQDKEAILESTHAGVAVIASAHAASLAEWKGRPHMGELFSANAFSRYVLLSRRRGAGTIEKIYDTDGIQLPGVDKTPKVE